MEYKDYYGILGVSRDADQDSIQKAYRKLARKYHPDVSKEPNAEQQFKEVGEAYEVLKDPEKRAKYDRFGQAWKTAQQTGGPPPGFEDIFSRFGGGGPGGFTVEFGGGEGFDLGGGGFSSFFEALFGQGGPRGFHSAAGPRGPVPQRGADHQATITLGLEEAARGGERQLTLTDERGQQRTLRVRIPEGVRPGQRIRLSGQGGGGGAGGSAGDLYLTVEISPHPYLRLDGSDLHTTVSVTPWEAALGGKARIQTLNGPVTVKIPAGSSSGRRIRLRGKGFPAGHGKSAGDLYAELSIEVPAKLSGRERELFEELAQASDFEPKRRQSRP